MEDNKDYLKRMHDYMHGIDFKKAKLTVGNYLTHGFHTIILIAVMCFGFIVGLYYKEVSLAMKPKTENSTVYRYSTQISASLTDKNELLIIDKPSGKVVIYSDTCGMVFWKMVGEKMFIKAAAPEVKPTKTKK